MSQAVRGQGSGRFWRRHVDTQVFVVNLPHGHQPLRLMPVHRPTFRGPDFGRAFDDAGISCVALLRHANLSRPWSVPVSFRDAPVTPYTSS